MHYPKLKFQIISYEKEFKLFTNFLFRSKANYFKERFLTQYPELKNPKICLSDFINQNTEKKKEIFLRNKKRYEKEWKLIEKEFHKVLIIVLNDNWPKEPKESKADLSLAVAFPRYLDTYYFVVAGESAIDRVMNICAHELTHFLYFKKFKELFPEIPKEYYSGNHIEWVLSEILVSIILNDNRFKGIFAEKFGGYKLFYTSKIGDKTIMQIFEEKYEQMIETDKKKFDDYLKWAYEYAKEHEKELMVVK